MRHVGPFQRPISLAERNGPIGTTHEFRCSDCRKMYIDILAIHLFSQALTLAFDSAAITIELIVTALTMLYS
jgi:hypothetical protein